jgi:hypothetical protein
LNPAEQVWQQLRDRCLAARRYDKDNNEQVVDACCDTGNKFPQIPDAVRLLWSCNWAWLMFEFKNE